MQFRLFLWFHYVSCLYIAICNNQQGCSISIGISSIFTYFRIIVTVVVVACCLLGCPSESVSVTIESELSTNSADFDPMFPDL